MRRIKTEAEQWLMDAERVLINPLNRSPSKQQYSFSKASRWPRPATESSNYAFYNIPSTKSRIASSIGNSKRTTFNSPHPNDPAPTAYSVGRGLADESRGKGCQFGLGRSLVKHNSFLNIATETPTPSKYNPETPKSLSKNYSFSKETKFKGNHRSEFPNLGPGSYSIKPIIDSQKILSTQLRSPTPKIVAPKAENRKKRQYILQPLYLPKVNFRGEPTLGSGTRGFVIGTAKRSDMAAKGNVPGPGRYHQFSDFLSKGK